MTEINNIQGIGSSDAADASQSALTPNQANATSFDDMLKGFLKDVNQMQQTADTSIEKMVAGEVKDVHQVMMAVEEAKVAFNLMLEIRNKTMDAYNELIRMRS
ncbi:MAG TPA: flagellar hook-basal body complex protein FliE [Fibrobacteraceae bacterium]|nr:flagellar hook-basal body complex protein FliE [Fibrobacteraceae bacterium]